MSEGIKSHFEPNTMGADIVVCMRCGHGMVANDEAFGGTISRSESSFDSVVSRTPYVTGPHTANLNKKAVVVASHHMTHGRMDAKGNEVGDFYFYECPNCGNDDLPVIAMLDSDRLRLKDEDARYPWKMPDNPVVWMPCEEWTTKKGKKMNVEAIPLTEKEIGMWMSVRGYLDSTYSIKELKLYFKHNRRRGRAKQAALSNLWAITDNISLGVKDCIKHGKGMLVVKHSSAHHGTINMSSKMEDGVWVPHAWRKGPDGKWVDVCNTNSLLDPKWTGEFAIDRGAPETKTEWIKDETGWGYRTVSKIYNANAKAMDVLEDEVRHVLFIEDMGDEDEDSIEPEESIETPEVSDDDDELDRIPECDYLRVKDWQGKALSKATTLRNPPTAARRKELSNKALARALAEEDEQQRVNAA